MKCIIYTDDVVLHHCVPGVHVRTLTKSIKQINKLKLHQHSISKLKDNLHT